MTQVLNQVLHHFHGSTTSSIKVIDSNKAFVADSEEESPPPKQVNGKVPPAIAKKAQER